MKTLHYFTERLDTLQVMLVGAMFCACILVVWVVTVMSYRAVKNYISRLSVSINTKRKPVNRFKSEIADEADLKDAKQSITIVAILILFIIIFSVRTNGQRKLQPVTGPRVTIQH